MAPRLPPAPPYRHRVGGGLARGPHPPAQPAPRRPGGVERHRGPHRRARGRRRPGGTHRRQASASPCTLCLCAWHKPGTRACCLACQGAAIRGGGGSDGPSMHGQLAEQHVVEQVGQPAECLPAVLVAVYRRTVVRLRRRCCTSRAPPSLGPRGVARCTAPPRAPPPPPPACSSSWTLPAAPRAMPRSASRRGCWMSGARAVASTPAAPPAARTDWCCCGASLLQAGTPWVSMDALERGSHPGSSKSLPAKMLGGAARLACLPCSARAWRRCCCGQTVACCQCA